MGKTADGFGGGHACHFDSQFPSQFLHLHVIQAFDIFVFCVETSRKWRVIHCTVVWKMDSIEFQGTNLLVLRQLCHSLPMGGRGSMTFFQDQIILPSSSYSKISSSSSCPARDFFSSKYLKKFNHLFCKIPHKNRRTRPLSRNLDILEAETWSKILACLPRRYQSVPIFSYHLISLPSCPFPAHVSHYLLCPSRPEKQDFEM